VGVVEYGDVVQGLAADAADHSLAVGVHVLERHRVQALSEGGVDVEEVCGDDALGLGGEEFFGCVPA